ncbi:MAG: hypothetical protein WCD69_26605, partial [Xanthobacteraceae bacterium]
PRRGRSLGDGQLRKQLRRISDIRCLVLREQLGKRPQSTEKTEKQSRWDQVATCSCVLAGTPVMVFSPLGGDSAA